MKPSLALFAGALALVTSPLAAQEAAPAPVAAPAGPPKLIIMISVDQFSADLFAAYRNHFTGGFRRLLDGAVFPSGYQSHAATETCPGHSTLLTGDHPARTGIIANDWTDLRTARADKVVYCAEDESVPGSTSAKYTVSDRHLLVPTLGERMKGANPQARIVSVAGKDRAAVMMGGHRVDELWWWDGKQFVSYAGRAAPEAVTRANAEVTATLAKPFAGVEAVPYCASRNRAVAIGAGKSVGTATFARPAGDARAFRASPELDGAVFTLALGLINSMQLGKGQATDLIAIGASATDYVGHTYGTNGNEMCLNLATLDDTLGDFFDALDKLGVDYLVALSADHGGHDLPERLREQGAPDAARVDAALAVTEVSRVIAAKLKLSGQLLYGGPGGDVWIDPKLPPKAHAAVLREALALYRAHPQVAGAFSRAEIEAAPAPDLPPPNWTLIQRAKSSFYGPRSGDIVVALRPRVTPIPDATRGYVATHGSFWDYDRRVPMLFWRRGMVAMEQPLPVETVDIAPTLAATIGIKLAKPEIDGRCLDLDAGAGDSCR